MTRREDTKNQDTGQDVAGCRVPVVDQSEAWLSVLSRADWLKLCPGSADLYQDIQELLGQCPFKFYKSYVFKRSFLENLST